MTGKELGEQNAFPLIDEGSVSTGMNLREYYAGLAMQGIVSAGISNGIGVSKPDYAAHWAVEYADALLEELAKEE